GYEENYDRKNIQRYIEPISSLHTIKQEDLWSVNSVLSRFWYKNGQLMSIHIPFLEDTYLKRCWYDNGQIESEEIITLDGFYIDLHRKWHPNGQISLELSTFGSLQNLRKWDN